MHEEMMVGFRRRRTQSRSGWGTPRPTLVASDVVSPRLVVGPVAAAAIIGGALGLTAVPPDDNRPGRQRHDLRAGRGRVHARESNGIAHTTGPKISSRTTFMLGFVW
jgi:hypothetical protein